MFCPKCGASIPDDSAYCPNCGRHVKDAFDSIRKYSPNPAQRTARLAYLLSPSGWFAFRGASRGGSCGPGCSFSPFSLDLPRASEMRRSII